MLLRRQLRRLDPFPPLEINPLRLVSPSGRPRSSCFDGQLRG